MMVLALKIRRVYSRIMVNEVDKISCIANRFSQLIKKDGSLIGVRTLFSMLALALGARARIGDASRFIYEYAREKGYDIPAYPLAGSGEIKQFFSDEGIHDIPGWYERKLGIRDEAYSSLPSQSMVVIRNQTFQQMAFLIDGIHYSRQAGFALLAESDLARSLSEEPLGILMADILEFLLDGDTQSGSDVF